MRVNLKEIKLIDSTEYELDVPGMTQNIKLVRKCFCVRYNSDWTKFYAEKNCSDCNGTGYVLTNNGKTILKFVERFSKLEGGKDERQGE